MEQEKGGTDWHLNSTSTLTDDLTTEAVSELRQWTTAASSKLSQLGSLQVYLLQQQIVGNKRSKNARNSKSSKFFCNFITIFRLQHYYWEHLPIHFCSFCVFFVTSSLPAPFFFNSFISTNKESSFNLFFCCFHNGILKYLCNLTE